MNRGVLEVENLMATGNPNLWYNSNVTGGLKPPPPFPLPVPPPTATYLPSFFPSPNSSSSSSSSSPSLPPSNPNNLVSSWFENRDLPLDQPWSLSQLLLGGLMMGEEERIEMMMNNHHYQEKKLEDWEEQVLRHQASMKQESNYYNNNSNNGNYAIMTSPNSPLSKSCVKTTIHNINEDHNNNNNNHNGLKFSESNSSEIGGSSSMANKKPKLQVSSHHLPSSSQSTTLKVRKEKLGGRIAALHQLVSPFGKTDTASVLSEAIGYIRFLHSQVEALSLPYFGTPSRNKMMQQQHGQGDMNGIFPEDPGQLVNEYYMKKSKGGSSENQESSPNEEPKKDLRSRGLCLVPISCTLQVGSENGADYWAPAFGINFR